ncbi:protein IQ-DOMAIN 9-like isoform X2 [Andrographis paniculata]|uniref:protein IQ-DOMAIN 9-like isoform X2 n=1 Tax=Andrographis paniculata TaxID=175694 RepID=UPI0021E86DF9|nr:protein IQ-DOMAIN 9-like isoform X2 [Andrographis paniculata]
MGSGVWFRNIISKKKTKGEKKLQKLQKPSAPENTNACEKEIGLDKVCPLIAINTAAATCINPIGNVVSLEDAAAAKIQTAYRAYSARKSFHRMRRMSRLQDMVQRDSVKKQASATLSHLHSWSRIQARIRQRRAHMVTEGQLRQKKLENQLKLEAKIHDLEVEWSGSAVTADEAIARIHQREEAAVRRERAMAYAFSHQWRANTSPSFGPSNQELSKANWGWSWMDRWIAAQPWESRVAAVQESPKKGQRRPPNKIAKTAVFPANKALDKVKAVSPNGKITRKARKLSYEGAAAKIAAKKVSSNGDDRKTGNGKEGS